MKGYVWAGASVLLVSSAQLLMKWAMVRLPALSELSLWLHQVVILSLPVLVLLIGIVAYSSSLFCWFVALRSLPLSRLYPLLSLSYVLVWLVSMVLPGFHHRFHSLQLAGMVAIVTGLLLICYRRR